MANDFINLAEGMNSALQGSSRGIKDITQAIAALPTAVSRIRNLNESMGGSAAQLGQSIENLSDEIDRVKNKQTTINEMLEEAKKKKSASDDKIAAIAEETKKKIEELKKLGDKGKKELEMLLATFLNTDEISEYMEHTMSNVVDTLTQTQEAYGRILANAEKTLKKGFEEFNKKLKAREDLIKNAGTNRNERILNFFNQKINKQFDIQKETADSIIDYSTKSILTAMLSRTEAGHDFLLSVKGKALKDWNLTEALGKNSARAFRTVAYGVNTVGDIASSKTGAEATDKLFKRAGDVPYVGPFIELFKFLFDRASEVGRKGKELYEVTAGRYGYGDQFNRGGLAMDFQEALPAARDLGSQYNVSVETATQALKGLGAYIGVKSFGDLRELAQKTLEIANATGLAADEVTRLGAAYQKNFGLTAKQSIFSAGTELLGMMDEVNRGVTNNLLLSNTEMAALMTQLTAGAVGIDVRKTLLPFISQAVRGANELKFTSAAARNELVQLMLAVRTKGEGLPQGLASFMLIQGGQFKNTLTPQQTTLSSQVGRGKFAYEIAAELSQQATTSAGRTFWGSDKFKYSEGLADIALKLKGGNLTELIGSLGPNALTALTGRVMELYSIPGAQEVFGVSFEQMLEKFTNFARFNRIGYTALGGDIEKVAGLAEATRVLNAPKGTYSAQQLADARKQREAFTAKMDPAERLNQLMEKLLQYVDTITITLVNLATSRIFGGSSELIKDQAREDVAGDLTDVQLVEYMRLNKMSNRNDQQEEKYQELLKRKEGVTYNADTHVDAVSGTVTTNYTVVNYNSPYVTLPPVN